MGNVLHTVSFTAPILKNKRKLETRRDVSIGVVISLYTGHTVRFLQYVSHDVPILGMCIVKTAQAFVYKWCGPGPVASGTINARPRPSRLRDQLGSGRGQKAVPGPCPFPATKILRVYFFLVSILQAPCSST